MTREEAQQRAAELNDALPADADHRWIAHHAVATGWEVARISAGGRPIPASPTEGHGERGAQRPEPVDPRSTITRLIPPVGPPGL